MLKIFKPTWMVESIYHIRPNKLKHHGVKMVLTDLDNTLIAWNHPYATEEAIAWIKEVEEAGIPVVIISNNTDSRVKKVADVLELPYVPFSLKPFKKGFKEVMARYDVSEDDLLMVGDQVLTDVWGANRAGIRSVLVKPLMASDAWNTKINRFIELNIMKRLIASDPMMKWSDSLDDPLE